MFLDKTVWPLCNQSLSEKGLDAMRRKRKKQKEEEQLKHEACRELPWSVSLHSAARTRACFTKRLKKRAIFFQTNRKPTTTRQRDSDATPMMPQLVRRHQCANIRNWSPQRSSKPRFFRRNNRASTRLRGCPLPPQSCAPLILL